MRSETCAKRKSTSFVLYSHSCVRHIAGLSNRQNYDKDYAYPSDILSRLTRMLRSIAYEAIDPIGGRGDKFGWMVWDSNTEW